MKNIKVTIRGGRMAAQTNSKKDILKNIKKRYIIAFVSVFIMIITRQIIIQLEIEHNKYVANIIDVAGRQRMLSQQISKDVLALSFYDHDAKKGIYLSELKKATTDFEKAKSELLQKNKSGKIEELFKEIDESYNIILSSAKDLFLLFEQENLNQPLISGKITLIESNEPIFLSGMEKIVALYSAEANNRINFLSVLHTILFIIVVLIILSQLIFVFIPGLKKLTEAFNEIVNLGLHDKLTGFYNRYFFDNEIEENITRAERYHEMLSIIILDLDKFKNVNDTWGHPTGDDVLVKYSSIAAGMLRISDIFARLGGEEFIILLPNTDLKGAVNVAEKIRAEFERYRHPIAGQVTASFGVAQRKEGEPYSKWYKRADDALYQAKEKGRNLVVGDEIEEQPSLGLVWSDDMESGNEEIDCQHKELFEIGNRLLFQTVSEKGGGFIAIIDLFNQKISAHFEYELGTLEKINYPDLENHKAAHQELIQKANQLKEDYFNGKIKVSAFLAYLIDDVIVGHMLIEDRNFFPFMTQR